MKKILEVLRYGENDIRFHTDINPAKDPEIIHETVTELAMAMMTTLWGGNEQAVLAMLERSLHDVREAFEESGGKLMVFGPGFAPPKKRS